MWIRTGLASGAQPTVPLESPQPLAFGWTDHLVPRPGQVGDMLFEDNGTTIEVVVDLYALPSTATQPSVDELENGGV